MSQVLVSPAQPATQPGTIRPLGLYTGLWYLVLVLLPVVLKLAHLTRVAAWPWEKVTFLIWAPWLLVAVMAVCVLLALLLDHLRARAAR